jgi:hypothetical protein
MPTLSPLRARLASFDHAYAVAIKLRRATGRCQFVILSGDKLQPIRVTSDLPQEAERLLALIV